MDHGHKSDKQAVLKRLNRIAGQVRGVAAIETGQAFQEWFVREIRAGMPPQRVEQADIPIHIMPNGDTAGSRGAAIEALKVGRDGGLL